MLKSTLKLYRKTLKRIPSAHRAVHWLLSHTLIPTLEKVRGFQTMPDDPFWFRLELLTQTHEAETHQVARRLLRPGMVALDVGAHVGYYARLFSQAVGPQGRVLAFEPHPRNFHVLQRNLRSCSNVEALALAVGETQGSAQLHDYLMMSASGSLNYDERLRETQQAAIRVGDLAPRMKDFEPQVYTVPVVPLDDVLDERSIQRVDLIKMDIEGAELGALRGLQRTLQRSPDLALIMEYNPLGLRAFGTEPLVALDEIVALGLSRWQVIETGGALRDLSQAADLARLTDDLIAHMGVVNLLLRP
ncbi:MAG: FkbM family methyltransferase [Anaerolineae bacterium]|nr:FkbM family methyltransferase [Anaerolineae bacterium]MDW8173802.1 FkbM family methyltransferase [Anaerolineae bacterium]